MAARARWQTWYRERRERWLRQREDHAADGITLTARRVYILPTRPGLAFTVLLLIMLIGALNYNLGLGFALTFFTGACAVADMFLTNRNLVQLQLTPGRAAPVFAGEQAQFALQLHNPTRRDRFAIQVGFEHAAAPAHAVDVAAGAGSAVVLSAPAPVRGWLPAPRIRLATSFPLGLFRAWAYWKPPAPAMAVLVYPAPEMPALPLPSRGAASEDGHGAVGLDNFAGIRAYQQGDPLRHLAWRQIARHDPALGGHLVTKQFDGGAVAELALDLADLPAHLDLELRLSRLTQWVLQAELRALPYRLRIGADSHGPGTGAAHRAACLRALALYRAPA
ncbi:hypothetical protein ASF61_18520 [Duganella sp. Leaf126]|uniref:DUF58 domain-containing protein n=1 Tax=Duganella sp. Leaf126 TaxID=1736266 RepID=UPI0006FC56C7|nr:DUF58 domain-containing protein [Duganella sp. Leaf126]KQQ46387.1 hypothetical protein ASF61_18520 [Duganella sp. Leaf126]